MDQSGAVVGSVSVYTSSNGGHTAEFYTQRLLDRLIHIADTAPEQIKEQARHYRATMEILILQTIKSAMASERSTVLAEQRRGGFHLTNKE